MTYTRLDTQELRSVVTRLRALIEEVDQLADTILPNVNEGERKSLLPPPLRFGAAGRVLVELASDAPALAALAEFDAEAVAEDLDNAQLCGPVVARLEKIARRVEDSELKWLAEAYDPSLRMYRLAKACAKDDGRLESLVKPLEEVFTARKARVEDGDPPSGEG